MANMCVMINTERDIAAQIIRHKSISFQEYSTRYSEAQEISLPTFRRQDHKNRQNSFNDLEPELVSSFVRRSSYLLKDLRDLYNEMIEADVAKETARRILPLCTKTTMYANASLRSWIHYLQVRTDLSTQQEHRGIADMIKLIFEGQFPIIAEAAFGPTSAVWFYGFQLTLPGQEHPELLLQPQEFINFFGTGRPKVVAGTGRPPHGLRSYCALTLYL